MTVEELKLILDCLPDHCEVVLRDFDGDRAKIEEVVFLETYKVEGTTEIIEIRM